MFGKRLGLRWRAVPMALLVLVLVLLASPALVGFAAVRGYPELAISLVDQEDLRTYTQLIKQVKSNEGLDDQEKQEAINLIEEKYVKSRNAKIPADKLNVDTLERAFERRMALERQYEKSMGTILNKYFSDANYKQIAVSVKKEDKILAMKKIIELLDTRKLQGQEKALALYYLDKFAPYAGDEQLAARNRQFNVPDRDVAVTYSYTTNSYNRTKARQYIDHYWNSYNPDFPNLTYIGGDCTNFASQVLHAGNLPMDYRGGWYVYPKQIPPRYPAPKSIGELNYSWSLADPSSWISAKQFNRYWSQHVYSKERYSGTELKNLQTFDDVWRKAWHGDVVQILRPVWWWYEPYHTLEVYSFTFISSKDIILAAHTNNTKSLSFKEIINRYSNYKFDIFYVKQGY